MRNMWTLETHQSSFIIYISQIDDFNYCLNLLTLEDVHDKFGLYLRDRILYGSS